MKRTIFFDLATRTGWALGDGDCEPEFGAVLLAKTGENIGAFLVDAEEKFSVLIAKARPELIGFEMPVLPKQTQLITARKLYSLAGKVEELAVRRRIECVEANLSDIRRHFLGRGYPRDRDVAKAAACARCRALGWDVRDNDEADALAGLDYVLALQSPAHALRATTLLGNAA